MAEAYAASKERDAALTNEQVERYGYVLHCFRYYGMYIFCRSQDRTWTKIANLQETNASLDVENEALTAQLNLTDRRRYVCDV